MRVHFLKSITAVFLLTGLFGCGGDHPTFQEVAPSPRRLVMWLGSTGLDGETAAKLKNAGVDQVVIRRGSIDLGGRAPVLRLLPAVAVEGAIPLAVALEVEGVRPDLDSADAEAVWRGLAAEFGSFIPAEIILDFPHLVEGIDGFIVSLTEASGVAVVPILSFEQLQTEQGRLVAEAARVCIVPSFGTDEADLRGVRELGPLALAEKLAPIADSDVRVRPAVVIGPRTLPELNTALEDLDPLTEGQVTTVSTTSPLDRSFNFEKPATWSGKRWQKGDSVAVRWMDAAKLNQSLQEIHRLVLPEVAGWDLVVLPPDDLGLGLPQETLLHYLEGFGPEPDIQVRLDRNGRTMRIRLTNSSPFASAVANFGNWIQISVDEGWIVADSKGSFERIDLGTFNHSKWEQGNLNRVNAARFFEVYLAPGEEVVSGSIRVPSGRSRVRLQWHLTLSDGTTVEGESSG